MRQSNVRVNAARAAGDSWAEPSGSSAPVTTNPIPPGGGANRPVNGSVPAGSPDSAGLQRGTASEAARSPASPSTRAATSAAAPINVRSPLPCAIPSAGNVLDPGNKAATAGVGPVDGSGRTGLNASALSVPLPALHDRRSAQDLGDSDGMSLGSGVAHLMSNDGPNADGVTYYDVGGNAPRERYLPGGEGEWVGSEKVRNKGPAAASKPRARGLRRLPSAFNPRPELVDSFRFAFRNNPMEKAKQLMARSTRNFMENADAKPLVYTLHCILISASILAYCAETLKEAALVDFRVWVSLELFFTVAFTLEIVLRWVAAWQTGTQRKFVKDPLIWVDVVSIAPFYFLAISCASDASSPWGERCGELRNVSVLKILQAVKILRVFKLFRHFSHTRLLVRSFQRSYAALLPPMLFLFVSSAVFAGLVYLVENALTEDSVFHSVVDAVYFSFVTITTVGYGDQVPQSTAGRFVASVLMVYGVIFTAMPLTIVGSEFVAARDTLNFARKHLRHGAAWSVRHSEFTTVAEPITRGNKMAVYHVVADQYLALSSYTSLVRRLMKDIEGSPSLAMLADVRACLQAWSIKTVMFLAGLSFVIKEDSSQLVGVTDMVARVRKHAQQYRGRFDAYDGSAKFPTSIVSPVSSQSASPRHLAGWKRVRRVLWTMMEDPYSIIYGQTLLHIRVALMLLSIGTFVSTTEMDRSTTTATVAFAIQASVCGIFLVLDFGVLVCAPTLWRGLQSPCVWTGFITLIPVVVDLGYGIGSANWLGFMACLYLVRVVSIARHFVGAQVLWSTILDSTKLLLVPLFLFIIFTIVFATALYLAETDDDADDANTEQCESLPFTDVFRAAWVIVTTMTTVGYGDASPKTQLGRLICAVAMVFGVLYMAMPIAIVGTNFYDEFKKRHKSHGYKKAKRVVLPARFTHILQRYKARASDLARLLVELDTEVHISWMFISRSSLVGAMPVCLDPLQGSDQLDTSGKLHATAPGTALSPQARTALLHRIAAAHADLIQAHGDMAAVLDHVMHRLNGMVFENGVWVQEVGRAYRSRVQSVAMRLGRQYVNARGTPTAKAAAAASHDIGNDHRGQHAVGVPSTLSPERHLKAVPSSSAIRTMHRPEPSQQHLKQVQGINARLSVMRPAHAASPGMPAIAGSEDTVNVGESASRREFDASEARASTQYESERELKGAGPASGGIVSHAPSRSPMGQQLRLTASVESLKLLPDP